MIVQKDYMAVQISKAKQRGLPVAVGGPFASSTPDAPELDLADFKILDEGEITLPMSWMPWNGEKQVVASPPKETSQTSPPPRFHASICCNSRPTTR